MRPMYLLSRPASLAMAPTMLEGFTPCAWPTSMRNDSMPTSGFSRGALSTRGRSLGARSKSGRSMREVSRAGVSKLRAAGRSSRTGRSANAGRSANGGRSFEAERSLRCGRSPREGRSARSWRSLRSNAGGGADTRSGPSNKGVSPCSRRASAAAMSTIGTLFSCS